jgi:hypothetical protein
VGVVPAAELSTRCEAPSLSEADPARVIACEEPINANEAAPAVINKVRQSPFRNRLSVNERFGLFIFAAGVNNAFYNFRNWLSTEIARRVILAFRRQ